MKDFKNHPNKNQPNAILLRMMIVAVLIMTFMLVVFNFYKPTQTQLSYSDFLSFVESGKVTEVLISDGKNISGVMQLSDGKYQSFVCVIPYDDSNLIDLLKNNGIKITGKTSSYGIMHYVSQFLPWIVFIVIFLMFIRSNNVQNGRGMDFGKSNARLYTPKDNKTTFNDVAGQEEAKEELAEIIDYLKDSEKYERIGAKIPKGVLLVGNPGTGKTLMARAVAGEAGVSFLHISGSDFVEMFVGVGASRVRDLFEQARKIKPCIIFIDEIDAVGRARGAGLGGGHDEREQTLNQLLVEMDGFDSTPGIIVLAATNRPDVLDSALLRPGRFDRQVTVALPDLSERKAILNVHAGKIQMDESVDLEKLARSTPGMSGADLANILNEAAIFASRRNLEKVSNKEVEDARDKILMGAERKSLVMSEKERFMTAYHEAGHAIQYFFLENVSPLHKVTIIPRGRALGVTIGLPEEDKYSETKIMLDDELVIFYGGYAAEKLIYGTSTTGASNDIQRATEIAHKMVCEWGMSEELGPVSYGQEDEPIFMGRDIARHKMFSEETARLIDLSVRNILENAQKRAFDNLSENKGLLDTLAKALVEKETLSCEEIVELPGFEKFKKNNSNGEV
ncbi:MAG: ATP-dependent zinc metalloprotease FtsH [Treponemataceae bacterium]|nr:ATP-dependent zinc metalloprotease FtsH [Spirochaetales bacterium]MDY6031234.1 ATP-dependent zinc metalloprotease FtsH [Treponemataceae bacterium]